MVVSLYFHIPFCTKKCPYCHFYVIPNKVSFHEILRDSLASEWERQLPLLQGKKILSIYFGGGTPTLFAPAGIAELLDWVKKSGLEIDPDCEITIEGNPEETTYELLKSLRSIGINRLSLGVQSLDDRSLLVLERAHSAKRARLALLEAEKAGFKNISMDLMYDLPEQTEASWRYTLEQLHDLPISHLSLYNLTIEPHTSFHKRQIQIPTGELSLSFLHSALEKLEQIGLKRYEISAFARTGCESKHNLGYWTGRPFLGFGPSAFSYWKGERFRNIANIQRYAGSLKRGLSPVDFREQLSPAESANELLAVRLRLKEGVDVESLESLSFETKAAIEKLKLCGLVKQDNAKLQLTDRGMLFYDTVASEII